MAQKKWGRKIRVQSKQTKAEPKAERKLKEDGIEILVVTPEIYEQTRI